ncbi:alpha-tectorin [Chanos chanos]|uniref:Alpha-tectorin n=1 Tax=Chanos chanos TaxID=29144 RepID=A0A6J2VDG0_CHACN|nr:alpha-tectorin-like [Chanos chanos]
MAGTVSLSSDPCMDYTSLDEPWRATINTNNTNLHCDNRNWRGWYRLFYHGISVQMPEWCVDMNRCGTHAPLWITSPHPQIQDGVVTRQVCGHWNNNCCQFASYPIRVKACPGNYYVYEFVRPIGCWLAYCTGSDAFYPFGIGDTVNGRIDDGSSSVIYLLQPFIFFGQTYHQIYVNNNGHLTFNQAWYSYTPFHFPAHSGRDIIAPFWTDIDNRGNGVISYRQYTSGSVLRQATQDINQYFPNLSFNASFVFIATWDKVAYYSYSGTETSFQVVVISDDHFSFILMNYGVIAPTHRSVQAGYDTSDSAYHFSIPGSFQSNFTNLRHTSNVNVPGRWAFRTDHGFRGTVSLSSDPCMNYTSLDEPWRATNNTNNTNPYCDNRNWRGWYRLFYHGISVQMPEWCVDMNRCGTHAPLWITSPHPQIQDGVVTRQVCGHWNNNCCQFASYPIRVKACPGNYYVYEFVRPVGCWLAYCTDTFYPFGIGDTENTRMLDGSSSLIHLLQPFVYFGHTYNQIYVNNNGHLTFDHPFSYWIPYQFPANGNRDIIAPFWADIDTRQKGTISYRQYISGSILTQATEDINQYFPDLSFNASFVFVATWDRVPYYPTTDTATSFQVVLISGGNLSFVLMNYGVIAPTYHLVEAGYDTRDSAHHFVITRPFQTNFTNLRHTSNVNVPGRWAFRTDHGSRGCVFNGLAVQQGDSFWSDATCQQKCTCMNRALQCIHQPCTFSQACRPAAFQYACQNIPRKTCTISGDPHYYTFDNRIFHFQGTCTYILSEACGGGLPYYRIEGKNEHRGSTHVSWTRMVRVFVYGENIELVKGYSYQAKVNGSFASVPFTLRNGSVQVYQSGFSLAVSTDFGLVVTYDANHYVRISVPYDYQNATCGLCGNFNHNPGDDFRTRAGEILSSDVDFANSWRVSGDTDPDCQDVSCSGLACAACSAAQRSLYNNAAHCGILSDPSGPFSPCHSQLAPENFVENCVYDLCVGGGYQPILCQALSVYSAQCQQLGIQPELWRGQGFCEIPCPANSHFESQGTGCPATCNNPTAHLNCPLPNQESCVCDGGFVRSAGECVPSALCGCTFEGLYYTAGQTVLLDEDCGRLCVCNHGVMSCSAHQCSPQEQCVIYDGERSCRPIMYSTCWVEGLGSYRTFDGLTFSYPGACSLTLARVMGPSSLPHFQLTVEKVPRGNQGFARVLRFEAEGTQISVEMEDGGRTQVDGQWVGLPFSIGSGQIRIYHSSVRGVVVETTFGVTVRADWPHIVRITAPGTYNGTLGGLCGNLNGDIEDEFYSPNGALMNNSREFGNSWRDGSLSAHCEEQRGIWEPGHFQNNSQFHELCSIMISPIGPFSQCNSRLDPWQRFEECIEALAETGGAKEALCEALHGYTLLCQQNAHPVGEWRNITNCEPTCPPNSHYELCGTSCPATCPSLSFPYQCTQDCQEGCQCNDGLLLNGDSCVPPMGCGCHHAGRYRQGGERFWHGEECQSLCECNGATGYVSCSPSACSEQETCRIEEGDYGCHPRPHATCAASGDPHYSSFDGRAFDFQGTCRYVLATICNDTGLLPFFKVDAKNEPWHGLPVSITVEIFVNVSGHIVHVTRDMRGTVEVDGETRNLPVLLDGGRVSIYASGQNTFVSTDFGLSVSYDGSWTVQITVPANYSGVTCGLCGNFNGQRDDDFLTQSGELASSAHEFGEDWRVDDGIPCNDGCGDSCPSCHDQTWAQTHCEILRADNGPLSFCHDHVDPQPYINDCVFDVCLSGNREDVLCRSIQTYVSACQSVNARIYSWRENTTCRMECPENSHYEVCGTDCGHTCASSIDASCERTCSEGCFCDDGYVRSGGRCVPVEQCGCLYDGFYFDIGEQFWTPGCSQRCECFAPNDLRCSASSCSPAQECTIRNGKLGCYGNMATCTVWGDPHYITFDGAVVHFQGTCSYEIAQTCGNTSDSGLAFRVVATNRHRGNMVVSFVSVVDVWLSNGAEQTHITIGQNRKVKVNGDTNDSPSFLVGSLVEVSQERGFVILNASSELMVHFDGHSTLLVRLSANHGGSVCGMCGNYNGNSTDDKVLPNGDQASSDIAFGHSWKSDTSSPGCGASDRTADDNECPFVDEYTQLCAIITNTSGPFQNCHLHVDPAPYLMSCVYDLCLYTPANGMLCSAVEAYEAACSVLGLQIPEWRADLHCSVLDPCADLNCTEDEWCGEKNGVYGCFCNEDLERSDPETYGSIESCASSSGSMSLSRCQLFEAGFPASILHLNDPTCTGTIRDGRVEFQFDNDANICGTTLMSNGTHFIYKNSIQGVADSADGPISRERRLNLRFCCEYPLTQSLSMNIDINPLESIIHKKLPSGQGRYQVRMIPYQDAGFSHPFTGSVNVEVNQRIYVAVRVDGVDSRQISTVMDTCWATPVNDPNYHIRWDLIIGECPNPADNTVELLQNGVSTTSRFSFRMFTFTTNSSKVFLHCNIHLCLLEGNDCTAHCYPGYHQRGRRSVDIHDSISLSMGPLIWSNEKTDVLDVQVRELVRVSKASGLGGSLMVLLLSVLFTRALI